VGLAVGPGVGFVNGNGDASLTGHFHGSNDSTVPGVAVDTRVDASVDAAPVPANIPVHL
jgi:hypothetical protein